MNYLILFMVMTTLCCGAISVFLNSQVVKSKKSKIVKYYSVYFLLISGIILYYITVYFNLGMFVARMNINYEIMNGTINNIVLSGLVAIVTFALVELKYVEESKIKEIVILYFVFNIIISILLNFDIVIKSKDRAYLIIMLSYVNGYIAVLIHLFFMWKLIWDKTVLCGMWIKKALFVLMIITIPAFVFDNYFQVIKSIRWYIPTGVPIIIVPYIVLCLINIIFALEYFSKRIERIDKKNNENNREFYEKYSITEREKEVIEKIKEGKTNQEIADELFISLSTIKKHISNIFEKTSVKNRVELINLEKSM